MGHRRALTALGVSAAPVALAIATGLLLVPTRAWSQEFPTKPIRIVVMAAPGGLVDIAARTLGTHMTKTFGQPVIVENRPGGGGNIATEFVAKSPPDGHTLLSTGSNHAVNQTLLPSPGFDYDKDVAPVSMVAVGNMLMIGAPNLPANSVAEVIALAKRKPGSIAIGHAPIGTPGHIGAELLNGLIGGDLTLVTYKGIGAIVPDVISGQIHLAIGALPAVLPLAKAGRVKAMAVTGATRDPLLPDVPTIAESGVAGYDITTWVCIMTTGGTPRPVIDRLNVEIRRIMALPEVKETFAKQGTEAQTSTPDELASIMKHEATKWAGVLKNAKIKPQ